VAEIRQADAAVAPAESRGLISALVSALWRRAALAAETDRHHLSALRHRSVSLPAMK